MKSLLKNKQLATPPRNEGLALIGDYMNNKPIMRDPMDSEEAKEMQLRYKLMESIEYDFTDWECKKLYDLAMYDLLTSSECKIAIMLMAQKLGNIPIPGEDE